ncbi:MULTISPECIES: hypothetical protein [Xanthomonas]|uniref:Uncharacterized protein n=1 Tax=Xanthomonas manihotis TaxID=43353 RepID=A0A8I1XJ66_XANMN|nr:MULTISPECIES: hypothetical protein [Xanthomonas]RWU18506.1 hypothetical protein XANMN_07485 [Xanthomonas phaseoli pv. manihotis str. CIO151]MBO9719144.1 hypothetical protein [Xanthomonas phaseoli pv. manihotis]MBO9734108.1 hypothetical protein [Xanthomonas phaseoli pv. phaseoli]MBO9742551.1 hypothetical protein [Xanthomonas phaseoli pv. phaseoli]MBO9755587.1 hypothetical protein [Xanthomonas phaseoli pv. manihotis]
MYAKQAAKAACFSAAWCDQEQLTNRSGLERLVCTALRSRSSDVIGADVSAQLWNFKARI